MIHLVRKLVRRFRRACLHLRSRWYQGRFRRSGRHRRFVIGPRVLFNVPVRSSGLGSLEIGGSNCFGFPLSARVGTGEILIQPRDANAEIVIGEGNAFSNNVAIVANERITIGDQCRIGDQVAILDCDFHELDPGTRNRSQGRTAPVEIGNNVWLGSRVMILKGVTIGDNSVVGAMSMVNRSIPPNCLAAGFPARVVRFLDRPAKHHSTSSSCA